jgi:hypothetical protein
VQSSEDGHHDGLSLSSFMGAIAVGIFSDNDSGTDHPFGVVVV